MLALSWWLFERVKVATSIDWEASTDDLIQHASSIAKGIGLHNIVSFCFPYNEEACQKLYDGMCIEVVAFDKKYKTKSKRIDDNVLNDITNLAGPLVGAPQSAVAVSSSPKMSGSRNVHKENSQVQMTIPKKMREKPSHDSDFTSIMQRPFPEKTDFKTSPFGYQQENMVSAFQQDRTGTGEWGHGDESPESPEPDDRSISDNDASSVIRPPSSNEGRQEVVLFHLDDHPIRAYINWNSYEEMMHDIAFTFAIERDALVDAYEIAAPVSDIGDDAVPTIAHIVDDIPLGRADKLVLFDVQYHAHMIELNFRLGPVVIRSVIPVPPFSVRNDMLKAAKVDRFCRAENDRCLVFLNEQRWPDYDEAPRVISNADYVRMAVPPSERFACSTMTLADLIQQGSSDQQILDAIHEDEAVSNVSPSMLNDTEVRALAPAVSHQAEDLQNIVDMLPLNHELLGQNGHDGEATSDVFQAMQIGLTVAPSGSNESPDDDADSLSPITEDWLLDLQRVVQGHIDNCLEDEHQEFMFSVYTWLVDHDNMLLCREPKIAILGGDPSEWAEDIIDPWKFHIAPKEHVFYDLVSPFVQRIGIEDHIAHIILTKRMSDRSSVLVTLNFLQNSGPSVIVRFATVLPKECNFADVTTAVPLLASFLLNNIEWEFPTLNEIDQHFQTRHGMGIQIKIYPDGYDQGPLHDGNSLIQLSPGNVIQSDAYGLVQANQIFQTRTDSTVTCSLTEEFLAYVQAASSVTEGVNVAVDDAPDGLRAQPNWVQDVWEKWVETLGGIAENPPHGPRLETWFMNPSRWTRCRTTRIVVLSVNFHQWEKELLAAWYDRADLSLPTHFAVVFPTPDDVDRSVQEQIIIEQQPEPYSKSTVVTLYDTGIDQGSPHSVAIVLSDRLDLRGAVTMMG